MGKRQPGQGCQKHPPSVSQPASVLAVGASHQGPHQEELPPDQRSQAPAARIHIPTHNMMEVKVGKYVTLKWVDAIMLTTCDSTPNSTLKERQTSHFSKCMQFYK